MLDSKYINLTCSSHLCGRVAEWSKALDLGSSHFDGAGSNPVSANIFNYVFFVSKSVSNKSVLKINFIKKIYLTVLILFTVQLVCHISSGKIERRFE